MTVPTPLPDAAGSSPGASGGVGPVSSTAARDARLAWIIGGSLLTAYAVLILTLNGLPGSAPVGSDLVLDAIWAVALVVFAVGFRRSGSVVARHPLGVVALLVAAAVPLLTQVLFAVLPFDTSDPVPSVMLGQTLAVVSLAALVVAALVIGRAGAVPHRWRWVPLIVVAVGAVPQILVLAIAVSATDPYGQMGWVLAGQWFRQLGTFLVLLLGILAIVLAPREQPKADETVQVYPPAA